MHAYRPGHLLWLGAIAALCVALPILSRREQISKSALRVALVLLLVGGELQRYFHDGVAFPDRLPLHLCNVTTWVAVLALITLWPLASEFTYFCGLAGAGMAIITPDMGADWPARFFINHGGLILTAIVLAAGGLMPIRRGAPWRAYGLFAVYIGLVGIFDWQFGVNYAFLANKPSFSSLIDWLGPWPVYIGTLGAIGAGLFWLLWLPLRPRRSPDAVPRSENLFVAKHFHGPLGQQPIEGQPSGRDRQQG